MAQGYNPYASSRMPMQQQPAVGMANTPYGQNPLAPQQPAPKKFSIPTWLIWVIGILFVGLATWLILR